MGRHDNVVQAMRFAPKLTDRGEATKAARGVIKSKAKSKAKEEVWKTLRGIVVLETESAIHWARDKMWSTRRQVAYEAEANPHFLEDRDFRRLSVGRADEAAERLVQSGEGAAPARIWSPIPETYREKRMRYGLSIAGGC